MQRRSRSVSKASCAAVKSAGPRVMGIDPSLTSSGWAIRVDGKIVSGRITTGDLRGPRRLSYARGQLVRIIEEYQPDYVVYEDYAMGKAGNGRVFDIGELGGVFKSYIWEQGATLLMVPPTCLKKFLTGKGNPGARGKVKLSDKQKKEQIALALRSHFGLLVPQHDEADAVGLMLMGEIQAGTTQPPADALLSIRLDALNQCTEVRGRMQSNSICRK